MEFLQGQVSKIGKVTEHIKKAKAKKEQALHHENLCLDFNSAVSECDALRESLNHISDKALLEANIYRLKAAELSLNYCVKKAKNTFS